MTRPSIIAYIESKAAKLRAKSDKGQEGWALLRHDARLLEIIADEIRAEMDVEDQQ